jgi:hypothetical protein
MTTDTPQRSVLLIGASQRILDEAVAALCDLGYTAQATSDFFSDITGQFDVTKIDLVVLGTQAPPDRQAELKEQIGAINPRVIFVQSLGGIPGLITSQVQGAFAADHQDPAHAPTYTPGDRSIRLTLPDPIGGPQLCHRTPRATRSSSSTTGSPAATTRFPSPTTCSGHRDARRTRPICP